MTCRERCRYVRYAAGVFSAIALTAASAAAQPDLRKGKPVGSLMVFPDAGRATLFYYAPGEMTIAQTTGGRPELSFLHVRYTGSSATGDRGRTFFRSVLTFRVTLVTPTLAELRDARAALRKAAAATSVELRPLPVRRLDAALVFTPLTDAPAAKPAPTVVSTGHFEPADEKAATKPHSEEGHWRERTYTVGMEPTTAQLFSEALERGQVALSVGYALYADDAFGAEPIEQLEGSPELVAALQQRAAGGDGARADETKRRVQLVRAGAIAITADSRKWPDLVRRVDINESVPPGYAALDIYCYDFNNDLRTDIYEKQVEIEALSVTGRPVRRLVAFQRDETDLYARTLAFSVAVRLDRPYRYRVIEVAQDGTAQEGAWQTARSWTEILDVTTRPKPGTDASPADEASAAWRSR